METRTSKRLSPGTGEDIRDDLLVRASIFIASRMGLHFPREKWHDLRRGLSSASRELGFEEPASCIRWMMSAPLSKEQIEVLASHLTVGETYFLREKRVLDILKEGILPPLLRARRGEERSLRIWSAGCSSGEEPYSIAILMNEMGAAVRDLKVSILATDINPHALRKAASGIYGEWSFRDAPRGFKGKYFRKRGDGYFEILPQIREMVDFSYLNLAEDSYPSLLSNTNAMDVILCRNVLMYFSPDRAAMVVERLHRSLVEGGWLIVSPCESSRLLFSRFAAVDFPDAVLFRKCGTGSAERGRDKSAKCPAPPAGSAHPSEPLRRAPLSRPGKPPHPPAAQRTPPFAESLPAVPGACTPSPLQEALALYEQGHYPEAEERLAAFPPPPGEKVGATLLLCRIFANQGKLAEARQLLEQAIPAHKLETGLHYLLAMILEEQGDLEKAAASLRRVLYLDQDLVLAHFSLANLALRQGRDAEARRHFANTVALLGRYGQDEILPESEGVPAGRLLAIIRTMGMVEERHEEQRAEAR